MQVVMPQLGETVKRGTVAAWHKRVGDRVAKDELLFEVHTDKVDTDIPAPASGLLTAILVGEGETVDVGAPLATIEEVGGARTAAPAAAEGGPPLSPVVRRLLAEHHLDASAIAGTGAQGRVTRDDVLGHLARSKGQASPAAGDVVVPMNRIRRLTAAHVAQSVAVSPHVLQAVEVDFSAVDEARRTRGDAFAAAQGFSLTYLPFVARAVCLAIERFPHVNASVRGDELVVHRSVHLGIAVDLGFEGLVVPVVKDAQERSVRELAVAVHALAGKARGGALAPDDVAGGTYTLSNSGTFGTLVTAPIIHQPQVAILSVDGVRKRPVAVEGPHGDAIAIRPVGVLAQCFDHRAFDGAYSAAFLREVRETLERRPWSAELS